MEQNQILFLLIIGGFLAVALFRVYKLRNKKCPKCGGKLALEKVNDPAGFNATKKVTVSFYQGPRKYTETWVCTSCQHKVKTKYWGT